MLLAIDVGNTQITGGLFDGEKLVFQFRRTTNMGTSSDEIAIFFRTVLGFDLFIFLFFLFECKYSMFLQNRV